MMIFTVNNKEETKAQGTDQLHKWLDGINALVSNNSISAPAQKIKKNHEAFVSQTEEDLLWMQKKCL